MSGWNDFDEKEFKIARWMGYVSRALEDYGKNIDVLQTENRELRDRMIKLGYKVAGIAATVMIISGIVMKYVFPLLPNVGK